MSFLDFQEAVINHIIFAGVFLVTRLRCRVILEQTTVIRFVSPLKRELDLDLIFPIKDEPPASFMSLKADCLCEAGVIGEREKQWVRSRVRAAVATDCKQAA